MLRERQILQHDRRIRSLDVQPLVHFLDVPLHVIRAPASIASDIGDVVPVRAVRQDPDERVVADAASQNAGARV